MEAEWWWCQQPLAQQQGRGKGTESPRALGGHGLPTLRFMILASRLWEIRFLLFETKSEYKQKVWPDGSAKESGALQASRERSYGRT